MDINQKRVLLRYIDIIKDMYNKIEANIRTYGRLSQLDCIKDLQ